MKTREERMRWLSQRCLNWQVLIDEARKDADFGNVLMVAVAMDAAEDGVMTTDEAKQAVQDVHAFAMAQAKTQPEN